MLMEVNNDRVNERFAGKMGAEAMGYTRERVFWVCGQVRGQSALDVGCSQGITPILLGREGIDVLGLDINENSLRFAEEALAEESEVARRHVQFACENFTDFQSEGTLYDTVIIGEVLEHLNDPARFVQKAYDCLADGGTLVVTVPFGINDDPDHKRTFYLVDIYNLIAERFTVNTVRFFGPWIGLTGIKAAPGDAPQSVPLDKALFAQAEEAFYTLQRGLITRNTTLQKNNEENRDRLREAREVAEKNRMLNAANEQIRHKLDLAQADNESIRAKAADASEEARRIHLENKALQDESRSAVIRAEKLAAEYDLLAALRQETLQALDKARDERQDAQKDAGKLRKELEGQRERNAQWEQKSSQYEAHISELEQIQRDAMLQIEALQAQMESIRETLRHEQETLHNTQEALRGEQEVSARRRERILKFESRVDHLERKLTEQNDKLYAQSRELNRKSVRMVQRMRKLLGRK